MELPDTWTATLEQTLENRYGDFTKPDFAGAPPVQTWSLRHRVEKTGEDGVRDRWFNGNGRHPANDKAWSPIVATFGNYGWWSGVRRTKELPGPLASLPDSLGGEGWCPAEYSLSRGIHKDQLHVPTLGPKGHVPEEFLAFGTVPAGSGVQFRT